MERKIRRHAYPTAAAFVPDAGDLAALAHAARACQGCDLYQSASQAVFGEGAADAAVVLIGEQPGDIEDRQGKPFAGPAGRLLDSALSNAGIPRGRTYVTNAVKHFRWKPAPSGRAVAARYGVAASPALEPRRHPPRLARSIRSGHGVRGPTTSRQKARRLRVRK